jgi:BirA family transcriptional regulator, biotin operon repressor / biotin---[acetyl-CoA-carboxylase] ligase
VARGPVFPPLIEGRPVKAGQDPFRIAGREALKGRAGAGDLFWSEDRDRLAVTLVLEPEVPPERCNDMLFVAMVAFGDCVGALAPPEVGVYYRWPQTILVNGGAVGTARLRIAPGRTETGAPDWLVVGLDAALRYPKQVTDPGLYPETTVLWEEGCHGLTRSELLESYARHLKTWIFLWESDGARPVRENWLGRAEKLGQTIRILYEGEELEGVFLGLDEEGNMLLKRSADTAVLILGHALDRGAFELAVT